MINPGHLVVWVDGALVDEHEARISPFDHGITVEPAGTDMWRIRARANILPGLDLTRTYTSYEQAVEALTQAAGVNVTAQAA